MSRLARLVVIAARVLEAAAGALADQAGDQQAEPVLGIGSADSLVERGAATPLDWAGREPLGFGPRR